MENQNEITIKLKKSKIINNIIAFLIFFFISCYMFLHPDFFVSKIFKNIYFIKIIGFLVIFISLILLISYTIKLFDNKVGLIITDEFIIDNSVFESVGKIYWYDIKNIKLEEKYVCLNITKKFEKDYIKRLNLLKKIIIIVKKRNYKSSIMISSVNLDCSNEELVDFINKEFKKYKEKKRTSSLDNYGLIK
jgi:hypothetical protein